MTVKELKKLINGLEPAGDNKNVCFYVNTTDPDNADYYRLESGSEVGYGLFEIFLEASYISGV